MADTSLYKSVHYANGYSEVVELTSADFAQRAIDSLTVNVPKKVSDRQFFQALAIKSMITREEALAAVKTGEIPQMIQNIVDEISDPDSRFTVEMLISGAVEFHRDNQFVEVFRSALNMSNEQVDDLFVLAGGL